MIKNVRDILHQQRKRSGLAYVVEVPLPQSDPTVEQKGNVSVVVIASVRLVPKLCAPDTRKGLTWRTANQHIHLFVYRTLNPEVAKYRGRSLRYDIASFEVSLAMLSPTHRRKIGSVRCSSPDV
jgi:hypothetical protein